MRSTLPTQPQRATQMTERASDSRPNPNTGLAARVAATADHDFYDDGLVHAHGWANAVPAHC